MFYDNKYKVRKNATLVRNTISKEKRDDGNCIICQKVMDYIDKENIKNVFTYVSYKSETDTRNIILKLLNDTDVEVNVPVVEGDMINFYNINNLEALKESKLGIPEPVIDDSNRDENIRIPQKGDLLLIPGLLFSKDGNRLGYGGGFYDRYIEKYKNNGFISVGICFKAQITEYIPIDDKDQKCDFVIYA